MAFVFRQYSNSWADLPYANDYFDSKYNGDDWTTISDKNKQRLLVSAFNWINGANLFSIEASNTSDIVKQAQCELAWFLFQYSDDYDKHRALSASGVKRFSVLDNTEILDKVEFPTHVTAMLSDFLLSIGTAFPTAQRDLSANQESNR